MIYIENNGDFTRQSDFSKEKAELEKVFPNYRTHGVRINVARSVAKYAPVFRPHETQQAVRTVRIQTPPSLTSPKVSFTDKEGVRREVIYTTTAPTTDKQGNKQFSLRRFKLEDGMVISGDTDLEKLIYLYFYSTEFTNGKQQREGGRYEFDIPSIKAKAKASDIQMKAAYATEIISENTRRDYKWVLSMFNALSLTSNGVEEDDRLMLYDMAADTNAIKFRERYENAKANIEALSKRDGSNKIDELNYLVKDLQKAGILKEKDGWWITSVANKDRTLVKVSGEKAAEKKTALVDWLISQPNEEETLKSYLD